MHLSYLHETDDKNLLCHQVCVLFTTIGPTSVNACWILKKYRSNNHIWQNDQMFLYFFQNMYS